MKIVPTWGGSMFEALMVPLFVPEETWGARSWGVKATGSTASTCSAWTARATPPTRSAPTGCATPRAPRSATSPSCAAHFDAYGPGGFYDAVAVGSGTVSKRYLSLDQGMIMAALGNELAGDDMRDYVSRGALADKVRPLMRMEVFASADR